jgi:hypothetical protein
VTVTLLLIGDAQHNAALAREFAERLARQLHREMVRRAQHEGRLRGGVSADIVYDQLFAPTWFNLLVLRRPLSARQARTGARAVLQAWAAAPAS